MDERFDAEEGEAQFGDTLVKVEVYQVEMPQRCTVETYTEMEEVTKYKVTCGETGEEVL